MSDESFHVNFVPDGGPSQFFPNVMLALDGTDALFRTLWSDAQARERDMDHVGVVELLKKLPWTLEIIWESQRDAALRAWEIVGIAPLLKHSGGPIPITGLDMRA